MIAYYCQIEDVAVAALVVTLVNVALHFYNFFKVVVRRYVDSSKSKHISTKFINDFFELSVVGRNNALASVLDTVAPFNVTVIPNHFIVRKLWPSIAGKSISNSVKVWRFCFIKFS
jgi:hypothetical protein